MVSRPCDHCLKVKRCEMVTDAAGRLGYLCAACKRELEYPATAAAALKRQILPSVPRHWTLVRAFRMLGVSVLTPSPHRSYEVARRRRIRHEDRIPGGPEYLYETGREAYRQAARRHHPDHGGTTEAMQAVNQAWAFIERRYGPGRASLLAGPRW